MSAEAALGRVLDLLEELQLPYMITGSFASNAHGVPRLTLDADIVVEPDVPSLRRFLVSLGEAFYADPDAAREALKTTRMLNIIHMASGFKVDLILRKERSFSREEFERRQQVRFLGRSRWFATAEDTILAKLEWSRMGQSERQFADAVSIARVQSSALDIKYLKKWAADLGVHDMLDRLLSDLQLE